jgi:N-acetylmuramoyl-L-alanine amidase
MGRRHLGAGILIPLLLVATVVLIAASAFALTFYVQSRTGTGKTAVAAETPLPATSITSPDGSASVNASAATTSTSVDIEVPNVVGKSVKVAEALVVAAGLAAQTRVADTAVSGASPDTVTKQWPAAGALVEAGSSVVITYQPRTSGSTTATYVVVIDAGHQAKANLALEPEGPGSATKKAKVAGGATGISTHVPEYKRTLQISLALRDILVGAGVKVVMVRTKNNVNIPNSKRASIGNKAKADLVVRIHLDSSTDSSVHGISTLYPSGNSWVKAIKAPSLAAARLVQAAVVRATGATSRGLFGRADMSGFNYSTRPTILVECGFLSNAAEDKLAAQAAYRLKIANGIAAGVMAYLKSS